MTTSTFTEPTVAMYVQMREDKTPRLVADGIPLADSDGALLRFGSIWGSTKKGRSTKACPINGYERFLCFSDCKVAGSVFVEPVPAGS